MQSKIIKKMISEISEETKEKAKQYAEKRITLVICMFGFSILSKLYCEDLESLFFKLLTLACVTFYILESLTCNKNK